MGFIWCPLKRVVVVFERKPAASVREQDIGAISIPLIVIWLVFAMIRMYFRIWDRTIYSFNRKLFPICMIEMFFNDRVQYWVA